MSPIDLCILATYYAGLQSCGMHFCGAFFICCLNAYRPSRERFLRRDWLGKGKCNAVFFVAFRLQWIVICRNVNDFEAAGIRGIFCFCFCVCVHIWRFCSHPSVTSNAVECFYRKNADTFPWISGILQRNWCFRIKFTRCVQTESIHRTHTSTRTKKLMRVDWWKMDCLYSIYKCIPNKSNEICRKM